jgi:mono/diheme cytochrome c family protein
MFIGVMLVMGFIVAPTTVLASGEGLFQQQCAACHTVGGGRLVGPDLAGVHTRRSEAWLKSFIRSSQAMVQQGDPQAVGIFQEYNGIVMPDPPITTAQIAQIVTYLQGTQPPAETTETPSTVAPEEPASQEDIALGLALFQGTQRLHNGGPTCNSCHHVKNDAVIGGGILAKDLTSAFSRMQGTGVKAILGQPPFPVMEQAYTNAPLTDVEIQALSAFLQHADKERFYQQPRDYGARLFYTGIVGVAVLFGLFALFGMRRKTRTVNHAIFARQDNQRSQDE